LEEKLVTRSLGGTGMTPAGHPSGDSCCRNSRDVTPKLASGMTLLNTSG
jgi:hypothetical protein